MQGRATIFSHNRTGRKILAALVTGAAMFVVSAGCDGEGGSLPAISSFNAAVPAGFVHHRSRGGEVSVRTPPSWRETSTSGKVVLNLRTAEPGSSVNVVVVPAAPGETLDKMMNSVPSQLRHEFADFQAVKSDLIFLNDVPAGRLVYEASRSGFHGKLMQVFITKGGRYYILTYTAAPDHYAAEELATEQVIASLQIEK